MYINVTSKDSEDEFSYFTNYTFFHNINNPLLESIVTIILFLSAKDINYNNNYY